MLKFFRDNRAGSNALVFIVIIVLLVGIIINFVEPVEFGMTRLILTLAYKKGLDAMQTKGGLTPEIEQGIIDFLGNIGFDESKISVGGTIAAVEWGDTIELEVKYVKKYKQYKYTGVVGLEAEEEDIELVVEGATVSYFQDNNL